MRKVSDEFVDKVKTYVLWSILFFPPENSFVGYCGRTQNAFLRFHSKSGYARTRHIVALYVRCLSCYIPLRWYFVVLPTPTIMELVTQPNIACVTKTERNLRNIDPEQ